MALALRYNGVAAALNHRAGGMKEHDKAVIRLLDRAAKRHRWPVITWLFVAITIAAFLYELSIPSALRGCFLDDFGAIPHYVARLVTQPSSPACQLFQPARPLLLTMIIALFLHVGWLPLVGNMLFLIIVGDGVEDRLGHIGFALFYLACGLAGIVAQTLANSSATVPILGASGAVAGLLAASLVFLPGAWVRTLLLIGLWVVFQALSGLAVFGAASDGSSSVVYVASLGGFAAGLTLALLYRWFAPAPPPRSASSLSA